MADLFSQVEVWGHVKSLSTPINALQLRGKDPMPPLELPCSHVCLPVRAHTLTHTLIRLASAQLHLIRLTLWYFLSSDSWSLADCRQGQQRSLVCNPLPFTSCNPLLFSCNFPVHMSDDQRSGTYLHNFLWCDVHMVKTSCVIVWLFFLLQYQQPTRFSLNTPKRKIQVLPCGKSHSDNTSNGVSQRWRGRSSLL